jgi:hypothetical protein
MAFLKKLSIDMFYNLNTKNLEKISSLPKIIEKKVKFTVKLHPETKVGLNCPFVPPEWSKWV